MWYVLAKVRSALREYASCSNKTEVTTHQFVAEKVARCRCCCSRIFYFSFWGILRVRQIFTILGRSAVGARRSRGRSAGRSATPDCQPERNPERNSENWAGARLERNSDFCRSANTLVKCVLCVHKVEKCHGLSYWSKVKNKRSDCSKTMK